MNGVIWGTKDLHRTWEQRILRDALYNRITTLELGFEKKKKTLETTVAVQNLRKEVAFFLR